MPFEFAITAGALLTGIQGYRKHRRRQFVNQFLRIEKTGIQRPEDTPLASAVEEVKHTFSNLTRTLLVPAVHSVNERLRSRYPVAIWSTLDENEMARAERALNRRLPVLGASLGLALAGSMFYAPLGVLTIPLLIYVLRDVYVGSFEALFKDSKINVDMLAAVLITAYIFKGYILVCHVHAMLYMLNRKLLNKVKRDSQSQVADVFRQQPRGVWVLVDGVEVEMPLEAIEPGDLVVAHAGECIAVDGIITEGMASIDQHLLTGESQPLEKQAGDTVYAMTMVLSGRVSIQVEKAGEETAAARIGHILSRTADAKTDTELWAETITNHTALPMLALGAVTYSMAGPLATMIFLNAHFRYRLVITASTCVLTYVNLAAQKGLLVKDGRTLESLSHIDTVVFDKTGTLTEDQPHMGRIHCLSEADEDDILRMAAAAEAKQSHPIARAILQAAKTRQLHIPPVDDAAYQVGYGVTVTLDDRAICVGSARFMDEQSIDMPSSVDAIEASCHAQGHSLVMVAMNGQAVGAIEFHATIRPEAKAIVDGLKQRGITSIYIISGDHTAPTQQLAETLGIEAFFAETLPEDKADLIERLQGEGRTVCYVGDGINDAIAMKRAEVSVSMRGASTIATDTAHVMMLDESLSSFCHLFDLAQDYRKSMTATFRSVLAFSAASLGGIGAPVYGLAWSLGMSWVSMFAGFSSAMWPLVRHRRETTRNEQLSATDPS